MAKITKDRYHGTRRVFLKDDGLADDIREVADDLGGLKVGVVTEPAAGATYTVAEQALLNEIRDLLIAQGNYTLKTTKG